MNRTITALAVLSAMGLASSEAARETLISQAAAQQPGETESRESGEPDQAGQREQGAESQIARAAGAAAMQVETIAVERSDEHGEYLVDGRGRSLYLLESESNGESMCYDQCAEAWPPAIAARGEQPEARGESLRENLLGTFERRNGDVQITYGDYPLYYYYEDEQPGDVTGQDVHDEWGGWYLVTPDGEPLEGDGGDARGEQD